MYKNCTIEKNGKSYTFDEDGVYTTVSAANKDSQDDDQISDDLSAGNLFFQDPPGKQQDKNIGGSINHRSEFHIHFGVAPGIQE